jgi:hypothetical protein
MNRRSLLSWLGLGSAAAATEAVTGPAYFYGGGPWAYEGVTAGEQVMAATRALRIPMTPTAEIVARNVDPFPLRDPDPDFLLTDWGGAL